MRIKKLFAAALAAGLCFASAAAPAKAAVVKPDGTTGNDWATYTVEDFYDSDKDVTEVKSFTFVLSYDVPVSATNDFNGQLVVQNAVDWAWNQKMFSGDASVPNYEGNPYDYELVVTGDNTAELTIPCSDAGMALMTLQDKIGIGDWNESYTVSIKDVKFNFGDAAPAAPAGDKSDAPAPAEGKDDAPALPKTGLVSSFAFLAAGALISGTGVVVAKGKKEK